MNERFDFNGKGEMLLVDKPSEWTSFDVVRKMRNLFHIRKIGHAGTLDPLATGLLILCTGPRTKELNQLLDKDKVYSGSFQIGVETPSYDLETEPTERRPWEHIDECVIRKVVGQFVGRQSQVPPMYSALKHKGRALYKYARAGKSVERSPREVVVHDLQLTSISLPVIDFVLRCSKGTYVRSLIHDIGATLGTGAVLTSLRRQKIGPWKVEDAFTIDQLIALRRSRESSDISSHDTVLHA